MIPTSPAMAIMAGLRLEDGRRWGDVAEDFQLDDARAVLDPSPNDPLLSWLGRPKGGSKTTDVAGMGMAWLSEQAKPLDEGYVIASDSDQARRLLDRARGMIARTSALSTHLEVQTHQILHRSSGAKLVALAADAAGAEGLLSPLILVDELPQWADTRSARAMWDAAYSSIPKVRGLRFVVIGHAGVAGSWQHKLYLAFQRSQLWRVRDVPGPLPWVDPAVLEDQRGTLAPSQYRRRHLNEWSDADDALASVDDLRECVTLDGPLRPVAGIEYVIGLDVGLTNDRTVAVVCHAETLGVPGPRRMGNHERTLRHLVSTGSIRHEEMLRRLNGRTHDAPEVLPVRVVLDRIEVWQGSRQAPVQLTQVEDWIAEAFYGFGRPAVVVDPYQAVGLAQRLRSRGAQVEEFTFSSASVGRLAGVLHQLIRDRALALPDDEELLEELAHVRLRESAPGVLRMDHDSGRHDDRAIAIALAAQKLLTTQPGPPTSMVPYRSDPLRFTR